MHEALRDHMGGSKYSLAVCLYAGVDGLSGLGGMPTKICVSSLQILSSSVRLDGNVQVSPEIFVLWLVHSRTFPVVPKPTLGWRRSGEASVGALRLVEFCTGGGPSGTFSHTGSQPAWALGAWPCLLLIPSWRAWSRQMRLFPSHLHLIDLTAEGGVCAPVGHDRNIVEYKYLLFEVKEDAFRSCWFKAEIFSFQSEALNAPSQSTSPSRILNSWRLSLSKAASFGCSSRWSEANPHFCASFQIFGSFSVVDSTFAAATGSTLIEEGSEKSICDKKAPKLTTTYAVAGIRHDKASPAFYSGQPFHAVIKNLSRRRARICSAVDLCCKFIYLFIFLPWTGLLLSSSGSRLRGTWSQSFCRGAADAASEFCWARRLRSSPHPGAPPLGNDRINQEEPSAVDQESEPSCSEVTGLTTNFFPNWCVKMKYRCDKSVTASPGGDSVLPLTHEWQNKERDLMSSLILAPSTLAGKHRESQMKASCWAHWIIPLSNTRFTHASEELKAAAAAPPPAKTSRQGNSCDSREPSADELSTQTPFISASFFCNIEVMRAIWLRSCVPLLKISPWQRLNRYTV